MTEAEIRESWLTVVGWRAYWQEVDEHLEGNSPRTFMRFSWLMRRPRYWHYL